MRTSYLRRITDLEKGLVRESNKNIFNDGDITYIYNSDHTKVYYPSSSAIELHNDNSFVQLVMGPYGSGKSTMCIRTIVSRTCQMPYWHHGRRKSKWIIVRNTSGELHSTTLQTWLTWFSEMGSIRKRQKPLLTYEHEFNDGKGIIELELVFIALDREEDVRKIKSLEATGVYINELSEVPQAALSHFKGRVNHRYPSISFCNQPYWSGIIADTNPPDEDHWIYRDFIAKPVEGYKIFVQPPGLIKGSDDKWLPNPECDNYVNMSKDFYTKLASGQTQDFIKVYCLGQFGIVSHGKRVFYEYNDDLHSVDYLSSIQGEPLHLGWDGGLTPACVVTQMTNRGQLLVLKEYTAEDIGARTFAEFVLAQLRIDFPYNPKISSSKADPSCVRRDEIMAEFSFIGELNTIGIHTLPAITNNIVQRLSSVRFFLNKMIDGKPAMLISRTGCPTIRKGMAKDYVYKRVSISGEERYKDEPEKNMSSHPMDALQYKCLDFAAESISGQQSKDNKIDMYNPTFRYL